MLKILLIAAILLFSVQAQSSNEEDKIIDKMVRSMRSGWVCGYIGAKLEDTPEDEDMRAAYVERHCKAVDHIVLNGPPKDDPNVIKIEYK